jgi:hypothetical protein
MIMNYKILKMKNIMINISMNIMRTEIIKIIQVMNIIRDDSFGFDKLVYL